MQNRLSVSGSAEDSSTLEAGMRSVPQTINENREMRTNAIHQIAGPQMMAVPGFREDLERSTPKYGNTRILERNGQSMNIQTAMTAPRGERMTTLIPIARAEESGLEGASKAAMGTGAAAINGVHTAATGIALALGGTTLSEAALYFGAPALAGAGIGGIIGKKYGHPVLGASIGMAAGLTASTAILTPAVSLASAGMPAGVVGIGGVLGAGAIGGATLMSVAVPCAVGAGLYGAGRLTSRALGMQPGGVGKNLLLGTAAVATGGLLPLIGYLTKNRQ